MGSIEERSEIVIFDLETTIPPTPSQAYAILEFGSIVVCPQKLIEIDSYATLVRPLDLSLISARSIQSNGITASNVASSPTFSEIADKVYDILHGRVWMGHNIVKFDCERLKEAYAQIKRPPPKPKRIIDTLSLLARKFGERAGNMKLASLAKHFELGEQRHRSLDDARLNFEVVKICALVLFLESSQQDTANNCSALNASSINSANPKSISPFSSTESRTLPINSPKRVKYGNAPDSFHTGPSVDKMESGTLQSNAAMMKESSTTTLSNTIRNRTEFVDPESVSMDSITVTITPFIDGPRMTQILHRDIPMQFHCDGLRIRFGLSTNFVDHTGNRCLSFVADIASSSNLCKVLDACHNIAKRLVGSDGNSQWRPFVNRKLGVCDLPTIRLHIPTVAEDATRCVTEIYCKNSSSIQCTQLLGSSRNADVADVESLFREGSLVDAYFSLEPYNYQQNVGIRLVAKKLIISTS